MNLNQTIRRHIPKDSPFLDVAVQPVKWFTIMKPGRFITTDAIVLSPKRATYWKAEPLWPVQSYQCLSFPSDLFRWNHISTTLHAVVTKEYVLELIPIRYIKKKELVLTMM
jgi:hypothetical protein